MMPTRTQFRAYLAGLEEAQRFIEEERARRMRSMSAAQVRAEFDALCELLLLRNPAQDSLAESERVEMLLERRRLLDLLAARPARY